MVFWIGLVLFTDACLLITIVCLPLPMLLLLPLGFFFFGFFFEGGAIMTVQQALSHGCICTL